MNNLSKKLHEIENHVLPDYPEGDTHIDWGSLPESERELHTIALDLTKRDFERLTEQELAIIQKSYSFIETRIHRMFFDLETFPLEGLAKLSFLYRLYWLIYEAHRESNREKHEFQIVDELEKKYPNPEESEEIDALHDADWTRDMDAAMKQYDNAQENKTEVWTPESWEYFRKTYIEPLADEHFKKNMKAIGTPEQSTKKDLNGVTKSDRQFSR